MFQRLARSAEEEKHTTDSTTFYRVRGRGRLVAENHARAYAGGLRTHTDTNTEKGQCLTRAHPSWLMACEEVEHRAGR